MKLSIIICVYNTAIEYLTECLESITDSTLKELDGEYEICMVDDGSSIDYTELVGKYSLKYLKTENRGIFSARKTGIGMASGEYAIYCDSDDTVSFNYYPPMLKSAYEKSADIVINDWAVHTPKIKYCCMRDDTVRYDIDRSGDEVLLEYVKNEGRQHSYYVLWNKLYKTELLRSAFKALAEAKLPERTSYSEDAAINFFAWRDAKRLVNVHTGYYFYRMHPTQSVIATTQDKLKAQIEQMSTTIDIMRAGTGENIHREEILSHISEWAGLIARSQYSMAKACAYTELYDLIKNAYGIKKLTLSTVRDCEASTKKLLLGTNFNDVDKLLLSLWKSDEVQAVSYSKKDIYVARSVGFLEKNKKIRTVKRGEDIKIPRLRVRFKEKLIHTAFLYKLGLIFFKKGSKARNFLKKLL